MAESVIRKTRKSRRGTGGDVANTDQWQSKFVFPRRTERISGDSQFLKCNSINLVQLTSTKFSFTSHPLGHIFEPQLRSEHVAEENTNCKNKISKYQIYR
jgi:hypothetical protein